MPGVQITTRIVLALILTLGLGGCVKTTTGGIYTKTDVDKKAAVDSHVTAARTYLQEANYEGALRHLTKAMEIDPKSAEVHGAMAYAFELSLDPDRAEEHYKRALREDPRLTSARNNYGVFLYRAERYKEARDQLRETVDDTLYDRRFSAFTNLALCDMKLGDLESAEDNLKRSLALNRRYAPAMLELAALYVEQGKPQTAQRYYVGFRQYSKQNARSLLIGVQIAAGNGDEDALASFRLALKNLYPESEEYEWYKQEFESGE